MTIRNWRQRVFKWVRLGFIVLLVALAFVWFADKQVQAAAEDRIFDSVEACPPAPVALLLGVAKHAGSRENLFYRPRIEAAAKLYKSGKVRGIIISGDHGTIDYNEPDAMKEDLMAMGIPEHHLTCDYAGFRTLDSIIRVREVFGQCRFIVVSQRFHCERAVFLARELGNEAWGFAAQAVKGKYGRKMQRREILARAAAAIDILIGTEPRVLGRPIEVGLKEI